VVGVRGSPVPTAAPSVADDPDLARGLDELPFLAGREHTVERVPGGLTNRIYRVAADGLDPVVVRLAGAKTPLLAIDRHAECFNSRAAAAAGVGPQVVDCDPDAGVAAVQWVDGRTLTAADLDDAAMLERVAALCRRLHAGPRFANDFDMFDVQRRYLAVVQEQGFRLPPRYLEFLPFVDRIRTALSAQPVSTVPCHNDLLAGNIVDDGDRLWFIDYEYAGNNDPCFELGNVWSEASLGPDRLDDLLAAYFGDVSPAIRARARLLALMSQYGWTLWASIQDAVGVADFDFWGWGMEKYERAVAQFDHPDLARLLEDAGAVHRPRGS
jgi:thiamine kinase-like enzyme